MPSAIFSSQSFLSAIPVRKSKGANFRELASGTRLGINGCDSVCLHVVNDSLAIHFEELLALQLI
jgi:hypothetical protein